MGLALLWKPPGQGSQNALADLKRSFGAKSHFRRNIGHTGTLDPFAEGLLLVGWDEGTKILTPLMGLSKTYRVSLALGGTTSTLDTEGSFSAAPQINPDQLAKLSDFLNNTAQVFLDSKLGPGMQVPPEFSAIKVDGQRAYDLARKGLKPNLKERSFEIHSAHHVGLEMSDYQGSLVLVWTFDISVSAGTYIRALARDWGNEIIGFQGFLTRLVRTAIGPFSASEAFSGPRHLSLADLGALFGTHSLDAPALKILRGSGLISLPRELRDSRPWIALDPSGTPLAWFDGESGRVGRVFLESPLKVD
jgi:tRNA pseudouridine55 synthase